MDTSHTRKALAKLIGPGQAEQVMDVDPRSTYRITIRIGRHTVVCYYDFVDWKAMTTVRDPKSGLYFDVVRHHRSLPGLILILASKPELMDVGPPWGHFYATTRGKVA